jgi:hypothetical protein
LLVAGRQFGSPHFLPDFFNGVSFLLFVGQFLRRCLQQQITQRQQFLFKTGVVLVLVGGWCRRSIEEECVCMDQFGCGVVGPCLSIVLPLLVIDGVWFFSLAFGLGFFATVVHASQVVGSAILSTVKSVLVLVIDVWFFSLAFGLGFFATVEVVGNAILSTVKSVLSDRTQI